MSRGRKAAPLIVLAIIFFFPALDRLLELQASGAARAIDLVWIFIGGFVSGVLLCQGIGRWRQKA